MKNLLIPVLTIFLFTSTQAQQRKCLLVLVDGIPADVIENTPTPALDEIGKKGAYARAYVGGEKGGITQSPTISAVGYNSMLTGTWANKHNVWGNGIEAPNYQYPTIFKVARENNSKLKLGIFSTWQDNRTKLIGEHLAATGSLKMDYVFDGYELDTLNFPHDKAKDYIKNIDMLVVEKAAETILKFGPDLSWVYLEYTDDMGHKYGDSPQFQEAIKLADKQIGELWKAIKAREKTHNEEWLLIITTDHGRDAATGKGHGGQSDRERTTWIATNYPTINQRFHNGLAIVDIFPSVAKFMNIELETKVVENLEGVCFID